MNTPDQITTNLAKLTAALDTMKQAMAGMRERLIAGLDLTRTQLEILMLVAHQPQTTGELARKIGITGSAVTQTVDTLVRRDLLERHPDEADRRITHLQLSAAGRALSDKLHAQRHDRLKVLAASLTPAEIDLLVSATEKFATAFTDDKPERTA